MGNSPRLYGGGRERNGHLIYLARAWEYNGKQHGKDGKSGDSEEFTVPNRSQPNHHGRCDGRAREGTRQSANVPNGVIYATGRVVLGWSHMSSP